MPPEMRDSSDAAEWLRRARSNLAKSKADHGLADILLEDLCFDAQQAAEKAIKGVLVHLKKRFPKTHVISDLLSLLDESGVDVPENVKPASTLTPYAIVTRYPGLAEAVTEEQYVEALEIAERVLRWAESLIQARAG